MLAFIEYDLESAKLDSHSTYDLINSELSMYGESVISNIRNYFSKIMLITKNYISIKRNLYKAYKEHKTIVKEIEYMKKLAKVPAMAKAKFMLCTYDKQTINFDKNPHSISDITTTVNNIMTHVHSYENERELYQVFNDYLLKRYSWDSFVSIELKNIPKLLEMYDEQCERDIEDLQNQLKNVSQVIENSDVQDSKKCNLFKACASAIRDTVKGFYDQSVLRLEVLRFQISNRLHDQLDDDGRKYIREPGVKMVSKKSVVVDKMEYGYTTFTIHQTEYPNISAFNYNGYDIYVDKNFFTLPKLYQMGIIYHEIGHQQARHFKPNKEEMKHYGIQDEQDLYQRIIKDMKAFLSKKNKYGSAFAVEGKPDHYDLDTMVYVLLELDADRFAANKVGKKIYSDGLSAFVKRYLAHINRKDDKELEEIKKATQAVVDVRINTL